MSTTQRTLDDEVESHEQPTEDYYDPETEKKQCYQCGRWFKRIGMHWPQSDCEYPSLTDYQHELITGMMLGDGYIHDVGKHSIFSVHMTNKTFVDWLHDELGYMSIGEPSIRHSDEHMSHPNKLGVKSALDTYVIRVHGVPDLHEFVDWYDGDGQIHYPSDLELTPLRLKLWYVSDGSIQDARTSYPEIRIIKNIGIEDDERLLGDLFDGLGWSFKRDEVEGVGGDFLRFGTQDSQEMFEYMGEPLPGFRRKWPGGEPYEDAKERHCTVNGEPYVSDQDQ